MGRPTCHLALQFYLIAFQRFEDAEILLKNPQNPRTTGAVYLAGYNVECILKALVLSVTPRSRLQETFTQITRGNEGHDLEGLKRRYLEKVRGKLPGDLAVHFTRVNSWKTGIRYQSGLLRREVADRFLDSATRLLKWADKRL